MKMKVIFVLGMMAFILSCHTSRTSQASPKSSIGLAQSEVAFSNSNGVPEYKFRIAQKVLDDLLEGYGAINRPIFEMRTETSQGAYTGAGYMGLEESAYDFCTTFGSDSLNAMASLLGHELVHFYEHHLDIYIGFSYLFQNITHGQDVDIDRQQARKRMEREADEKGIFVAQLSGYQTMDIAPKVLQGLYELMDLPGDIPGYPSLQERMTIAKDAQVKAKDFIMVFELANYLTAAQRYDEANAYYEHLLLFFPSREIYNNAGVCAAIAARKYFTIDELKYTYPLELDPLSRLDNSKGSKMTPEGRRALKMLQLKSAEKYFAKAIELDSKYLLARTNLACVYTMMGEFAKAGISLKNVESQLVDNTDNDARININNVLGIINAKNGHTQESKAFFNAANDKIAYVNLGRIFNSNSENGELRTCIALRIERIGGIDLSDYLTLELLEEQFVSRIVTKDFTCFRNNNLTQSTIYVHKSKGTTENNDDYMLVQTTNTGQSLTTIKGVKVGDTVTQLEKKYCKPDQVLPTTSGELWVYNDGVKPIFKVKNDIVVGWAVIAR